MGTGLLFDLDLALAIAEVAYDAEYQLRAATQVRCYIGYRGRNSSEIQSRYGQHVVQPFADFTASQEAVPEERPTAPAVTHCCNRTGRQEPLPEPVPAPVAEPIAGPFPEPVPEAEPEITEPELELPVPKIQNECDYDVVKVDGTPDTLVAEEPADATHSFYETIKTVHQIDSKTLDIESPLIDYIRQFVSVAAVSLISYVVGAETISSRAATKLAGVPERALLAEASLQAHEAKVDQLSDRLSPYPSEAAKHIVGYHEENDMTEVSPKPLERRDLGIQQFPINESTEAFVEGLFEPTLPLPGREDDISSLGPRAFMADAAYQAILTLSKEKLQVLKVIPLDGTGPHYETLFDFIKRVIKRLSLACLDDAKKTVHKFISLLLNPSTHPRTDVPSPAKAASLKFALRDYLSSNKGSVKTL
ncbi:hypothetical protein FBULB1_6783 [Fusarium bulbicola]|nr:hypothetical protein FBULB1_6783 [Fusarium bulbicola]